MGRQEQCLTFLLSPEPSTVPGSPQVPIWGFGPSTEGSGYLRGGMTATGADLIKKTCILRFKFPLPLGTWLTLKLGVAYIPHPPGESAGILCSSASSCPQRGLERGFSVLGLESIREYNENSGPLLPEKRKASHMKFFHTHDILHLSVSLAFPAVHQ